MAIFVKPKRLVGIKPAFGIQVNFAHALGQNLYLVMPLAAGGGPPNELLTNTPTSQTSTPTWVATQYGIGRQYDDSLQQADLLARSAFIISGGTVANGPVSIWLIFSPSQVTSQQKVLNTANSLADGTPAFAILSGRTSGKISYYTNGTFTDGSAIAANQWLHVVGTFSGDVNSGTWKLYLNGQLDATSSGAGINAYHGSNLFLGGANGGSVGTTRILMAAEWQRVITPSEVQQLYADPFCFMQPQCPQRRYWLTPRPAVEFGAASTGSIGTTGSGEVGIVG